MKAISDIWRSVNLSLVIGIAFIITYSIIYIIINSYEIDGIRYYSLFDDPMVSMRYAENIANGYGPVWNPGEAPVEGFSNPLWVYIMSVVHLFPIAKTHTSLIIQIAAVLILILNLFFIKRSTEMLTGNNSLVISVAVISTAMYLPLLNWSLQGLEMSMITTLIAWSFYLNLKNIGNNKYSIYQLVIPAIAILVRLDSVLIYLVFFTFLYFFDSPHRKIILSSGLIILFSTLALLFIWRYMYFSEILPNTYYLKMTGYPIINRIGKGFYSFLKFVLYMTPFIFLLPFWFYSKAKKSFLILPISIFSVMLAYSIYIGGDSWEWWMPANRFIAQAMPLFVIMTALSSMYLAALVKGKFNKLSRNGIFIGFSVIILLGLNYNSWEYLKAELLLESTFTKKDSYNNTILALEAKKISKEDATAGIVMAGTLAYFLERNCIDILGKNDKAIARMPGLKSQKTDFLNYIPGHMKYNYAYSIGELKPDMVLQLWNEPIAAKPYLIEDYIPIQLYAFKVFVRKDAGSIKWEQIEKSF